MKRITVLLFVVLLLLLLRQWSPWLTSDRIYLIIIGLMGILLVSLVLLPITEFISTAQYSRVQKWAYPLEHARGRHITVTLKSGRAVSGLFNARSDSHRMIGIRDINTGAATFVPYSEIETVAVESSS